VPYLISVVGIDDHHLADMFDLTTVHQPVRQQGLVAGQLAHQVLRGEAGSPHVTLPTQVVARGTSGPPPGG
jgi:DNA-binding LacI/PurR family transcriptional regulator